jgi:hypothetical protein
MGCNNTEPWNFVLRKLETSVPLMKQQLTWLFLAALAKNLLPLIGKGCRSASITLYQIIQQPFPIKGSTI